MIKNKIRKLNLSMHHRRDNANIPTRKDGNWLSKKSGNSSEYNIQWHKEGEGILLPLLSYPHPWLSTPNVYIERQKTICKQLYTDAPFSPRE
jgi:hypothetical protein